MPSRKQARMADQLDSYLDGLPEHRRAQFRMLRGAVEHAISTAPPSVIDSTTKLTFLPGQTDHPEFDDAADVFWFAAEQLMTSTPDRADELPLLYLDYHLMSRITRHRESLGFLLTDQRLIVQDDTAGIRRRKDAVGFPLYSDDRDPHDVAADLVAEATATYDWSLGRPLVGPAVESDLLAILTASVAAVLDTLAATGNAPAAREPVTTARDLRGRIDELDLTVVVKFPDDAKQQKHFTKLTKAFALPDASAIQFTVTDVTLAGPYGLVVTSDTIYSKDLMEHPVSTSISQVDAAGVAFSDDIKSLVLAADEVHTVPSHLTAAQRTSLVVLLREVVGGTLS